MKPPDPGPEPDAPAPDPRRCRFRCRHTYPGGFALDIVFETRSPVTALFGPSGSGKTSVLEMVAGLRRPQEGRVEAGGRVLLDTASGLCLPPERRRLGVVFQDLLLFPHFTVERNLRYGQRSRHAAASQEFRRVVEVLELDPLLGRRPGRLSGGERQRVALGRALLTGPEFLLLDEPLAALDQSLKDRILTYVERAVREWRIPLLYVSHSQEEVRRLAAWVVTLDQGRVVGEGAPDEVLATPAALRRQGPLGLVNLLRIRGVRVDGDRRWGWVDGQGLRLPPLPETLPSPLYARFPPSAVLLSRQDVQDVSARNHLRGAVQRVVTLPEGVYVAVDVGQTVWAVITADAARELDLSPGARVTCLIKTFSIELTG